LTDEVNWLRADEESQAYLAPADTSITADHQKIKDTRVIARFGGDFSYTGADQVQYIDISPKQMVGVSAGLIPFLEHDDANRALMGSNMQRQAVPLLVTEPPLVATGLEVEVAKHSGMMVRSEPDGYVLYVDAERRVKNDTYTSIHIEEYEIEIRQTKLGKEEFTRDIPIVSAKALGNLDENGIVRIGTFVNPGDILVGKVSPKSKSELTPEEKLLHAIFGRAGEDVKNDSLEVPSGVEGVVIDTQRFSRRASMSDEERKAFDKEQRELENRYAKMIADQFRAFIAELAGVLDKKEK